MTIAVGATEITAYEICKLAGVPYYTLNYWDVTGYLIPSIQQGVGKGSQRLYSREDVQKAFLTKKLLDAGISLESIRADGDPRITCDRIVDTLLKLVEETP